jgi:glutamate racemase
MNKNMPIGVFDSGLGGLTVLRALQKKLPNESFIYIGDTAHVPYGNKSETAIINYATTLSAFLVDMYKVKMIIIACNTASAIAVKPLKEYFKVPVLDVITPMQKLFKKNNNIQRIGIIGTHNTIKSKSYEKLLFSLNPEIQIFSQACPLFVPIIEEGLENHPIAKLMSKEYLFPLIEQNIDALILGCTHYPILKKTINRFIPPEIEIIDSAEILSSYTKQHLKQQELTNSSPNVTTRLLVTDASDHFNQFARNILNNNFCNIAIINPF